MNSSEPRIITLDIETSPIKSYAWGIWEQNVGLDMIETEWSILAFAAKVLGKRKVTYADTGGRGAAKVRDDKALLLQIRDVLNDADIVVAQNGKRFDLKKINARLIMHGILPYSPVRVIDTLIAAKSRFAFTSNKLEWTSQWLTDEPKSKHKKFPGFELWSECLKDNPKAWEEMKKYNIRDVVATEKYYLRLRPWIENHPNIGAYMKADSDHACPHCGSSKTIRNGYRVLQQGKYQRFHCQSCGGWSRGKERIMPSAQRLKLLVPS